MRAVRFSVTEQACMHVYTPQYTHTPSTSLSVLTSLKFYKDPVQYPVFILQIMKLKLREGKTLT